MAIYGDMLAFFPELKKKYTTFRSRPDVKAGYGPRLDETEIVGILLYVKAGDILRQNDTQDDVEVPALWTRTKLSKDAYVEDHDEIVYRRGKVVNNKDTGNFYLYMLETVVGTFNSQTSDPAVDIVRGRYV